MVFYILSLVFEVLEFEFVPGLGVVHVVAGDEGSEEHPPIDAAAQTAALGSVVVPDDAPSDVPDVDVS